MHIKPAKHQAKMKARTTIWALAFFLLATIVVADGMGATRLRWDEYKLKYGKTYSSQKEDNLRFKLFAKRVQQVDAHNSQSAATYRQGLNELSDWTPEELHSLTGTLPPELSERPTTGVQFTLFNAISRILKKLLYPPEIPTSLNWAEHPNRVGPVRHQGQCGSCWAFATAGLLEGQQGLNDSQSVVPLSVQQLLDCDRNGLDHGCHGGFVDTAIDYIIKNNGLEPERDYPYRSMSGKDAFQCKHRTSGSVKSTQSLSKSSVLQCSEQDLRLTLISYGPIAVSIYGSSPNFAAYESGIYYDEQCLGKHATHSVLLVGYGTTDDGDHYWILKNSWGPRWGQAGYFWLARDRDGHCSILEDPTIAVKDEPAS